MNRREFIIKTGSAAAGGLLGGLLAARGSGGSPAAPGSVRRIAIVRDPSDPVAGSPAARWAAEQLRAALEARGLPVYLCARLEETGQADFCVVANRLMVEPACEALLIAPFASGAGRDWAPSELRAVN